MTEARMRWRDVEPSTEINGELSAVLASVDALRAAWEDVLSRVTPEDFAESRRRSLRRHAIETGIIERLYDIDWGVTEALVAEGLTAEVAEREGGVDDDTLALIRDQFDALEFLADAVRAGTPLTTTSRLGSIRSCGRHGCITASSAFIPLKTATDGSRGHSLSLC
jgi:hypothetical protein